MIDKTTKEPEIRKATMIIRKLSADEKERRRELYEDSLKDDATLKKMHQREMAETLLARGVAPELLSDFLGNDLPRGRIV